MTQHARTVWRVVGVDWHIGDVPVSGEVSVDSIDVDVVEAVETAAADAGIELERVAEIS